MTSKLKKVLLTVIFILGYTNLSYELVVLRQLVNFLGTNTLITSIIMAFILLFLSVGYYWGSVTSCAKFSIRTIASKGLWYLAIWYMLSANYILIGLFFVLAGSVTTSPISLAFIFSSIFLIAPATAAGLITALIGRILHHNNSNYTGRFMAVDTLGSVMGSLITTLVLMSFFGVSQTIFCLVILTTIAAYILHRKKSLILTFTFFIILILCNFFINIFLTSKEPFLIKDDALSRLEIVPQNLDNSLLMMINGQRASKFSQDPNNMFDYIKFINQQIDSNLPKDKENKVLVLGAGGFTVGLNDTHNQYTFLDIEPKLKEISEKHFLKSKLSPNKKFIAQDAYLYMLNTKEKYDVIVLDVYSARRSMPLNFVSLDFFTMIKQHLNKDGIMIANIITSPIFKNQFSLGIDNTLRTVFPQFLTRQLIGHWDQMELANIVYVYHNKEDHTVYTVDKNSAMYGQY